MSWCPPPKKKSIYNESHTRLPKDIILVDKCVFCFLHDVTLCQGHQWGKHHLFNNSSREMQYMQKKNGIRPLLNTIYQNKVKMGKRPNYM